MLMGISFNEKKSLVLWGMTGESFDLSVHCSLFFYLFKYKLLEMSWKV